MKLADYLFKHGISPSQMQSELGIPSRSSMHRYLTGERRPKADMIQRILEITKGAVQLADFIDPSPPKCAAVELLPDGRERIILPWSTRDGRLDAAIRSMLKEPREEDGPSPHAGRALLVLGNRVRRDGDRYILDGRPTDLRRVIEVANRHLIERGQAPIPYPAGGTE